MPISFPAVRLALQRCNVITKACKGMCCVFVPICGAITKTMYSGQ